MSSVSFSANGKEVKNAYDSIISGESTFEWALYGYEDGSNEIELVDSGNGLQQLCDEFDEEEYQYAFARVTDPNTKLPRFVFISWCGESVPFTKKGMYNTFTNDVLRYFSGFHIHINARSKFDVDPDEIMKKVKSCSGANYSFHQNQALKNKAFDNTPKIEPKIELKDESNKIKDYSSVPKRNPLNSGDVNSTPAPKVNPLNSGNVSSTPAPKINPLNNNSSTESTKPFITGSNSNLNPLNNNNNSDSVEQSSSRRSSNADYNPLQPNASRKNSVAKESSRGSVESIRETFEKMNKSEPEEKEDVSKVCSKSISSRINAFQNQIQETNENNKKEEAIKKELSSKNLKNWEQHKEPPKPIVRDVPKPAEEEPPKPVERDIPQPVVEEPPKPVVEEVVQEQEQKLDEQNGNTVKALYSYEAVEEGELSFEENEILTNVVDVPGEGWWSGKNSKGEYGMFPANYVSSDLNATGGEEETEVIEEKTNKPVLEDDNTDLQAEVLYSYEAQDDTEISLEVGEIITGIILQDENWAIGFNQNSQQGMFPLNYVKLNK